MSVPLSSCCTLVPTAFFDPSDAVRTLSEVTGLDFGRMAGCKVRSIGVPQWEAMLIYADNDISGESQTWLPEMFYVLRDLAARREYNKIVCSYDGATLTLAIAQGHSLLLSNCYEAAHFTTAEYYIFLALKSLQLNPEVSTVCFRTSLAREEELSLYNYFKDVEQL